MYFSSVRLLNFLNKIKYEIIFYTHLYDVRTYKIKWHFIRWGNNLYYVIPLILDQQTA